MRDESTRAPDSQGRTQRHGRMPVAIVDPVRGSGLRFLHGLQILPETGSGRERQGGAAARTANCAVAKENKARPCATHGADLLLEVVVEALHLAFFHFHLLDLHLHVCLCLAQLEKKARDGECGLGGGCGGLSSRCRRRQFLPRPAPLAQTPRASSFLSRRAAAALPPARTCGPPPRARPGTRAKTRAKSE